MECSPRGNKGYKYGGAIQNMLLHRNISGAPLRRARNRLDRAANSSIATPVGFLRRLRRLACEVAVGGEDDCLMALKLFPIYFDNDLPALAQVLNRTSVAVVQLERRDEVAREYSVFRRFQAPECLERLARQRAISEDDREAALDGFPHDYAAFGDAASFPPNASLAIRSQCPCINCAKPRARRRNTFHAWLETDVKPVLPDRPWLHVAFEDLYSRDEATAAATVNEVTAFVDNLLARPSPHHQVSTTARAPRERRPVASESRPVVDAR